MTVLHIIAGLDIGGAERVLRDLVTFTPRSGTRHVVVSISSVGGYGEEIRRAGVDVHALGAPRASVPSVSHLRALRRLVREVRPEIVQGWMYHGNLAASGAAAFQAGAPRVVWSIRCSLPGLQNHRPMTKAVVRLGAAFSRRPSVVLYNSFRGLEDHVAAGFARSNAAVIPNGFDVERFRPDSSARESVRMELGLSGNVRLITMIANWTPMKDHRTFVDAAGRLAASGVDVHFALVGAKVDLANRELAAAISAAGVAARVHCLGARGDAARLLAASDIAALSSLEEAFPNVVGEAMACGVPCVASDVGDVRRIVGEAGLVVPVRSPEALADAWRALLAMSDAERAALGRAARDCVIQNYSISTMCGRYEEIYASVRASSS